MIVLLILIPALAGAAAFFIASRSAPTLTPGVYCDRPIRVLSIATWIVAASARA